MAALIPKVARGIPLCSLNRAIGSIFAKRFASVDTKDLPPRDSDQFDIVIVGAGLYYLAHEKG